MNSCIMIQSIEYVRRDTTGAQGHCQDESIFIAVSLSTWKHGISYVAYRRYATV
jgi:hypothetical protein